MSNVNEVSKYESVVMWNGSNRAEIDALFLGTRYVPQFFGRMNAVRLVVDGISIGLYDKLRIKWVGDLDEEFTVEKHRWGR